MRARPLTLNRLPVQYSYSKTRGPQPSGTVFKVDLKLKARNTLRSENAHKYGDTSKYLDELLERLKWCGFTCTVVAVRSSADMRLSPWASPGVPLLSDHSR